MVIKVKFEYGDSAYLKTDPEQQEYTLVGVVGRPGQLKFELSIYGEIIEVYDFEVSKEKDELKMLGCNTNEES